MNNLAICDELADIKTFKKEFDKRMFEAGTDKLNYPYSLRIEEFFAKPFFPAVLKNELTNGGIDKFLIETPEQLEKIKKFYKKFHNIEPYKTNFENCIFQQYIETPTNHQTYLRVLMSASGDAMGASLKYSQVSEKHREPEGIFEKYFWDKNSEYFLNCKGMFNYYSNGGNILFSQPRFSYDNRNILKAHNIDPDNPTIPDTVLEIASSIMKKCNKELGIICGFDFILNEKDNKWYYLENQAFPAIDEWAATKGIRKLKVNSVDDYISYCALELEARYEALLMTMKKSLTQQKPKTYELK